VSGVNSSPFSEALLLRGGLRKLKWLKEVVAAGLGKGIKNNQKQIVYNTASRGI